MHQVKCSVYKVKPQNHEKIGSFLCFETLEVILSVHYNLKKTMDALSSSFIGLFQRTVTGWYIFFFCVGLFELK